MVTSIPFELDGEPYEFTPHGTRRELLEMTRGVASLEWLDWLLGGLPEAQAGRLLDRLRDEETDDLDIADLAEVVGALARRSLRRQEERDLEPWPAEGDEADRRS